MRTVPKRRFSKHRARIKRLYLAGESVRDIARIIEITPAAVYWHLKELRADGELPEAS